MGFLMPKRFLFRLLLVVPLLFSCSHKYRLTDEDLSHPSLWPYHHGDLSSSGYVAEGSFNGKLDIVWEHKAGDKPVGPMTMNRGTLVYPGAKRRIKFYDGATGRYLGYVKSRGTAQTGVVVHDSLAFFSTSPPKNRLYCINLRNGKTVWKRPVKDASEGTIIVQNRLIIGSTVGTLAAYNVENGSLLWKAETEGGCRAPPAYGYGKIFQPDDKGQLYAFAPTDGTELYRVAVKAPIVSAAAVSQMVFVTDVLGFIYSVDPDSGVIVWEKNLDNPVWTTVAVTDDRLFVGHSGGELVALDASSGDILWRFDAVEVIKASPTVVGKCVIIGTMGGKVFSLDVTDGRVIDQRQLDRAVSYSPVTDGKRVYVATESGRIVCFGQTDEHTKQTDQ